MATSLSPSDMALLGDLTATVVGYEARTGLAVPCAAGRSGQARTTPLLRPGASFVTLEVDQQPAGCKGSLRPRRPLWVDVAANARRAAFDDHRYAPVTSDQLRNLTIRVSVLSSLEEIPAPSSDALAASLRPGVDGLLLAADGEGAVFLPQVWRRHPESGDFVAALVRKAGWSQPWLSGARAWRYTTQEGVLGPADRG